LPAWSRHDQRCLSGHSDAAADPHGVALGAVLGSINGLLVWKLDMPPIVVTLGHADDLPRLDLPAFSNGQVDQCR
jgi:hypothetical protein